MTRKFRGRPYAIQELRQASFRSFEAVRCKRLTVSSRTSRSRRYWPTRSPTAIEDPVVIEKIVAHLDAKAPAVQASGPRRAGHPHRARRVEGRLHTSSAAWRSAVAEGLRPLCSSCTLGARRRSAGGRREAEEDHDPISPGVAAVDGGVDIEVRLPVVERPDVARSVDHRSGLTHHRDEAWRRVLTI